jgi:hypothetical protein
VIGNFVPAEVAAHVQDLVVVMWITRLHLLCKRDLAPGQELVALRLLRKACGER